MPITLILKLILMVLFFLEVVIFGKFVSNMKCFQLGGIMSIAMTFSGSLFLSIALIDIIPEATQDFQMYFESSTSEIVSTSSIHQEGHLPLTMIIAIITYMGIMFIDKILIGQHNHVNSDCVKQDRKKGANKETSPEQLKIQSQQANNDDNQDKVESTKSLKFNTISQINWRPIILQVGMGIHAFFQTLAVGLQKTTPSVLALAAAILIHKWAQGLTLGLIYKKQGFQPKTVNLMILCQGFINIIGLGLGIFLNGYGHFVMGLFMSISAGTFLYISTAQVLLQQAKNFTIKKMISMVIAISFVAGLVTFEKASGHSM